MRKTYTKPDIVFEDFTLSASIASGCEKIVEGHAAGTCGLNMGGGMIVFVQGISGCTTEVTPGDDGSWNGMCYHVPIGDNNLFNS